MRIHYWPGAWGPIIKPMCIRIRVIGILLTLAIVGDMILTSQGVFPESYLSMGLGYLGDALNININLSEHAPSINGLPKL